MNRKFNNHRFCGDVPGAMCLFNFAVPSFAWGSGFGEFELFVHSAFLFSASESAAKLNGQPADKRALIISAHGVNAVRSEI